MALLRVYGRLLLSVGVLLVTFAPRGTADGEAPTEAQVKAGYLYNFALLVEWPATSADPGPLVIGVIGDANFGGALDQVKGRLANGRRIAIRTVDAQDDMAGIAMLFIAEPDDRVAASLLARVGRAPILTVGESAGFTRIGGIIRLYKEDGKLRFEVNITRAQIAGLRISSRMLGLARIMKEAS